jgi:hypothetical protein
MRLWNRGNTPLLLVGGQIDTATVEINMAVPYEDGNQSTSKSCYTTLGHIPKGAPSYCKDTCITMFTDALFFFFFFFPFFIRYLAHLHFQCYTKSPPYPPTPTPLPAHSPFLALAFPCSGAYKVCVSNEPLFPVMAD